MEKKPEFKTFDIMECLNDEEVVRHYVQSARDEDTEEWVAMVEDDARRACALYGFDPTAVGLSEEKKEWKPDAPKARNVREAVVA